MCYLTKGRNSKHRRPFCLPNSAECVELDFSHLGVKGIDTLCTPLHSIPSQIQDQLDYPRAGVYGLKPCNTRQSVGLGLMACSR
jgi:hypothetical protein